MRRSCYGSWWLALLLLGVVHTSNGQPPQETPTVPEVSEAYQSKSGEHAGILPGLRWERWRINDIRGWSLKFQRLSELRNTGVLTRRYRLIARKNNTCAEYSITDVRPDHPNVQIRPVLNVESGDVNLCR